MKTRKTTFFTQMLLAGVFLSMLATIQPASAQEPTPAVRRNVVKLAIPVGREYYGVAYERTLSDRWSLQAEGGYLAGQRIGDSNFEGVQLQLQGKRYLGLFHAKAPEGIFLAPFARYRFLDSGTQYKSDGLTIGRRDLYSVAGIGLQVGGQWLLFNNRIVLGGHMGPGYNVAFGNAPDTAPYRSTKAGDNLNWSGTRSGWALTGGIQVGFAF